MTNPTQQFKPVIKDRLFYNRFEYTIRFYIDEASCLRTLDHAEIDRMIDRRIYWREAAHHRLTGSFVNNIISDRISRQLPITDKTRGNLHDLAEILLTTTADFKLIVTVDQGQVYTNDLHLIDQLDRLGALTYKTYGQAVIGRPKNTIQLKEPQHQFRSYFKPTKMSNEQKGHLTMFLSNQPTVRLSPALAHWMTLPFNRTQDYYFVDHDDMSWLTMLSLVVPGLIRKTQQIIAAK